MDITQLTPSQLRLAADLKEKIAGLEKELGQLLGSKPAPVISKPAVVKAAVKPDAKKGGMSTAGKARIAAAQILRWARVNALKEKPAAVKPAKKRFTMSAAAKAKISAAAKARWAKIKGAAKPAVKSTAKPVVKKAVVKRVISPEARAKMAAAAKAMWAAKKKK